jgi:hypothetical protein
MSISRDQDAPIDLNPDDWTGFDSRKDATKLQDAIVKVQAAKNQAIRDNKEGEIANLTKLLGLMRSRYRTLRCAWSKLKLADIRSKYFGEADRARALGKEPPQVQRIVSSQTAGFRKSQSNYQIASEITQHFIRKWNISKRRRRSSTIHRSPCCIRQGMFESRT